MNYRPSKFVWVVQGLLMVSALSSMVRGNIMTFFISLAVLLLAMVPFFLPKKYFLPQAFLNTAVFFIYATLFLGEVGGFYERFWWWDIFLHTGSALVFGMIAFIVLALWVGQKSIQKNPSLISFFTVCVAVAIGAVWEIFEFCMDQLLGTNMQKSGLVDTMGDLMVDMLGAIIAAVFGYIYVVYNSRAVLAGIIAEVIEKAKKRKKRFLRNLK